MKKNHKKKAQYDHREFEQFFVENLEVICADAKGEAKGSIVFVHGVCHGAWCWENFLKGFSDRGYDCFALSLRGHGNSGGYGLRKQSYSVPCYVSDVKKVVEQCSKKAHEKPFLMGHSMGGAIVQQYIDKYSETIKGAILLAPVTAGGMGWKCCGRLARSKSGWCSLPTMLFGRNWIQLLKNSTFFVAMDLDGVATPRIVDEDKLARYNKLLCAESVKAVCGLIRYELNGAVNIPVFVIGSDTDAFFPADSLEKTANFYGTTPTILNGLCHDIMLDSEWKQAAQAIGEFLNDTDRDAAASKEMSRVVQ